LATVSGVGSFVETQTGLARLSEIVTERGDRPDGLLLHLLEHVLLGEEAGAEELVARGGQAQLVPRADVADRRPRCTLGAGGPPRVPPPPAGEAPSQAERGATPLSLGMVRRRQLGAIPDSIMTSRR